MPFIRFYSIESDVNQELNIKVELKEEGELHKIRGWKLLSWLGLPDSIDDWRGVSSGFVRTIRRALEIKLWEIISCA